MRPLQLLGFRSAEFREADDAAAGIAEIAAGEVEGGLAGFDAGDGGEWFWVGEGDDEAWIPEEQGALEFDGIDRLVGDLHGAGAFVAEDVVAVFPEDEEVFFACDDAPSDMFPAKRVTGRVLEIDGWLICKHRSAHAGSVEKIMPVCKAVTRAILRGHRLVRRISQGVSGRGSVVRFGTALGIASQKISGIINNFLDRNTKYVVETPAIEFIVVPARSAADHFHENCPSIPT